MLIKIETYWNVNEVEEEETEEDADIKIETYWNVNNAYTFLPNSCTVLK